MPNQVKKPNKANKNNGTEIIQLRGMDFAIKPVQDNEKLNKYECLFGRNNGRPTKYRKEFCVRIIKLLAQGLSLEEAAIEIGVKYWSLWKWRKEHKDFSKAIKIGLKLSEAWWMAMGRLNLGNREFNHILWMMNMNNRFGWTTSSHEKKVEHKIQKKVDINIEHSSERSAKILSILASAGAIECAAEAIDKAKVN